MGLSVIRTGNRSGIHRGGSGLESALQSAAVSQPQLPTQDYHISGISTVQLLIWHGYDILVYKTDHQVGGFIRFNPTLAICRSQTQETANGRIATIRRGISK